MNQPANPTPDITTSDKEEWDYIVEYIDGEWCVNRAGNVMWPDFMTHDMTKKAGQTMEEEVALRLYTGPQFHQYNTHLRFGPSIATVGDGVPPAKQEWHYVTTIPKQVF